MKRIAPRSSELVKTSLHAPQAAEPPQKPSTPSKSYLQGISNWFLYKISKYIPAIYPVIITNVGRKVKIRYKLKIEKLKGNINVLDLCYINEVEKKRETQEEIEAKEREKKTERSTNENSGDISAFETEKRANRAGYAATPGFTISTIRVRYTEMTEEIWDIVKISKAVWLENVEIRTYRREYFESAECIDILGSSVEQIKHSIVDIFRRKRRRVRINNENLLVFWDEYKGCTFACKYFDVVGVMKEIPRIKTMVLDSIDVTVFIIRELGRHPVEVVKFIKCKILPLKVYDLEAECRKTLKRVEFISTFVTPDAAEVLRSSGIEVVISVVPKE